FGRVDLRREVAGEEAVTVQTAGRHQDEDAECGVTEAESLRRGLGVQTYGRVDGIDISAVDLTNLLHPLGIVGQVLETPDGRLVEKLPEPVVTGHAALTVAQDVRRRQVDNG